MGLMKGAGMSAIAICLLVGSTAGVAAQEEADSMAPAFFSLEYDGGPEEYASDAAARVVVAFRQPLKASDPRASGLLTTGQALGDIKSGGNYYVVLSDSVRLVNDGGAWAGTGWDIAAVAGGEAGKKPKKKKSKRAREREESAVLWQLVGEQGYEGLTLFIAGQPHNSKLWGMIVPTDVLPLTPELPAADSEPSAEK